MAQTEDNPGEGAAAAPSQPPAVPLGAAMPDLAQVPTLLPAESPAPEAGVPELPPGHSRLAQGMSFVGTAMVNGPMTLAGDMQGNLQVAEPGEGLITVAETGRLVGDARALNISVLGRTEGLLDAAGGRVSLHATASVTGRIRYTHLQVNGADLNAQLERVRPDGDTSRA